jgi:hypothetical protein
MRVDQVDEVPGSHSLGYISGVKKPDAGLLPCDSESLRIVVSGCRLSPIISWAR